MGRKLLRAFQTTRICTGIILLFILSSVASAQGGREPFLKAAYLFHLSLFVEWPRPLPDRMNFCVAEDIDNSVILQEALLDKYVHYRPINVNAVTIDDDLHACQLLYIPKATSNVDVLLASVQSYPVLTIGETREFYQRQGMVYLFTKRNKIRFAFNLVPVRKAGLKISAQLLALGDQL